MQYQAVLSNAQHPEYGVLTVPFPIPTEQYDEIIEMLDALEIGDPLKHDCRVDEISDHWPVLKNTERTVTNIDELDYLAKRLDSFDKYEKTQFQGMAFRLDLHGIDEFINLSFCCQEATVVTDFNDLETLGRRHYLTMNGGCASTEELSKVDGEAVVARQLLDQQAGRVTPYGVAYNNNFEMTQLYNGHSFPQYRYEDCLMEVEMSSRYAPPDSPAAYLYLPVSQTQIERTMLRAGINNYGDLCLRFLESSLPEEIDATLNFKNENLSALNEMCRAAEQLSPADREKLGAVVSFAKPEQAGEIANLAKNLEQFDYVPKVRTPEEYGKHMIMESGHFEYDENLVGYIDFARYGAERMEQEQGQFVDRGYVAYQGTLRLDELMQGDPAENMGPQLKME
ncbi:antirestriction protein ArdA [Caproiciproducens sp. R2]|uniref:antirestriction protein ArdA n=1 Tax=Caproiciproducens sp. R2 TaxID=3435187 RepID=UPI0040331B9D